MSTHDKLCADISTLVEYVDELQVTIPTRQRTEETTLINTYQKGQ
jgi:hypothetical protein